MRFSSDFIDKVLEATDIYQLIGQYTSYKKTSGHRHTALCPFPDHNEKTPSFSVDTSKQLYYCFGCKKGGNAYKFAQDYMGFSFLEALEYLAQRANIELPQPEGRKKYNSSEPSIKDQKKVFLEINRLAELYFLKNFKNLSEDDPIKKYARKRGLTNDICETFSVGFAPASWNGLVTFLKQKNISLSLAAQLGLIRQKDGESESFYDMQRGRLMFPIHSILNDTLGFGGRIVGKGEPKYLNSPDSLVFKKRQLLYGLKQAIRHIRNHDSIVVVEGYMDAVALHRAGIKEVVAVLGTALTPDHAKLMGRYTKNVILLFDGDSSGVAAAEKSVSILLGQGLFPKAVFLPEEKDPDDYIAEHGVESLREKLHKSQDLFSLILDRLMESYTGVSSDKVRITQKIIEILPLGTNKNLAKLYLEEVSQRLGVSHKWLVNAIREGRPSEASQTAKGAHNLPNSKPNQGAEVDRGSEVDRDSETGQIPKATISSAPKEQLTLLRLACKDKKNFTYMEEQDVFKYVNHSGVKTLFDRLSELHAKDLKKIDTFGALLSSYVREPEILCQWEEDLEAIDIKEDFKELEACVKGLKQKFLQEQTLQIKNRAKHQPLDQQALADFMRLKQNEMNLDRKENKSDDL